MSDLNQQARREAGDVRTRMPWLNATQAEEVTRHYIRRRIDLTRQMLQGTAQRGRRVAPGPDRTRLLKAVECRSRGTRWLSKSSTSRRAIMNVTARSDRGGGPTRQRMLAVYLNDHLAGATVGAELAWRMVQEHGDSAVGNDLPNLAAEISQDRKALLRLMADLDVPVRSYMVYGAWLGEKIGRLKPNGRLLRRSGLTVLVELEAMRLGVQGKSLLWRALLDAAAHDSRLRSDWLEQLLQRAGQQIRTLDSLHDRAATALLSPATPLAATSGTVAGGKGAPM